MKKQIILSSLFFVTGLFLSPVQAANLNDLEICPNPNSSGTPPVIEGSGSSTFINPLLPKGANQGVKAEAGHGADDNKVEVLEEGYTCKVPVVETRPDSDRGYKGEGYVQWMLMKKEGDKEIWAAHTERWGLIYVGDVEDDTYSFSEAFDVCKNKEIVINGEKIKMTLPEIGFGVTGSDIDNPLNFELLKYLNYKSVVSSRDRAWFWSSSPSDGLYAWVFRPASGAFSNYYRYDGYGSVRCVGR